MRVTSFDAFLEQRQQSFAPCAAVHCTVQLASKLRTEGCDRLQSKPEPLTATVTSSNSFKLKCRPKCEIWIPAVLTRHAEHCRCQQPGVNTTAYLCRQPGSALPGSRSPQPGERRAARRAVTFTAVAPGKSD